MSPQVMQTRANAYRLDDILVCPATGEPMIFRDGGYESPRDGGIRLPFEDGVLRAFLPNEGTAKSDVTEVMKAFYEETPFPDYDEMETVGSLIEKSRDRVFPEALNRSIATNADVLEVGCGTGQLGNFLSIANRRVLSVDMCLNSLKLAQNFKSAHGLESVTFAQMNLFRMPLRPAAFDVAICTGVLHHTSAPFEGFCGILPFVKPGGYIVIGLYNLYGRLKTRLRGRLFKLLGERFRAFDPYLAGHNPSEAKQHSWFMDQYRNPSESLHTMDEVLRWFKKTGVRFVRAVPNSVFGHEFESDYKTSLFEPEPRGSKMDRLLCQTRLMITDAEGGLFIMIGKKE